MSNFLTARLKFTRPVRCMAAATIDRHLLPAPELSSKPAGRCCRLTGQIDRQTDTRLFHDAYCILCGLHNQRRPLCTIVLAPVEFVSISCRTLRSVIEYGLRFYHPVSSALTQCCWQTSCRQLRCVPVAGVMHRQRLLAVQYQRRSDPPAPCDTHTDTDE